MTLAGDFTLLHKFPSTYVPLAGLIQATDGNFYGTTTYGGEFAGGTMFSMTPEGTLTTCYNFWRFVQTIPAAGAVSSQVTILGNHLLGTTDVSFNGTPAAFTEESPTYIRAIVPVGASGSALAPDTAGVHASYQINDVSNHRGAGAMRVEDKRKRFRI